MFQIMVPLPAKQAQIIVTDAEKNAQHFQDDIFQSIFFNENV